MIRGGGAGATTTPRRLAAGMVLVQAALAVMLLVCAGLMVRSLQQHLAVDLGFEPEHVLVLEVHPVIPGEDLPERRARRAALYREVLARVGSLPSVSAVGAIDTLPFDSVRYALVDTDASPGPVNGVSPRAIMPGYFQAMGMTLVAGRDLSWSDGPGAPCGVVVNGPAARMLWNEGQPLGRRVRRNGEGAWCEVVGVVRDARHFSRETAVLPEVYFDARLVVPNELSVVARSAAPEGLIPAVRSRLTGLPEPTLVQRIRPMAGVVRQASEQREQRAWLLSVMGGLGVLLACVGIFGLTSYAVARRTQEIGVRIALGAGAARVLGTVLAGFVPAIAGGVILGLFGAWATGRLVAGYLYGITPTDPVTLAAVSVLFLAAALMACYLPARRAMKVDPVVALRAE